MSDEPARLALQEQARRAAENLHSAEVEYQAAVMSGMPELFIPAAAQVQRARQELARITRAVPAPPVGLPTEAAPTRPPAVEAAPTRPPAVEAVTRAERVTVVHLTGSRDEGDWLEAAHQKTRLSKGAIVRAALSLWAASNGHPPPPPPEDD